jgi:hypothetical protein
MSELKKVPIRVAFDTEVEVLADWDDQMIMFWLNDSSWCLGNLIHDEERKMTAADGDEEDHFCGRAEAYLRAPDDRPRGRDEAAVIHARAIAWRDQIRNQALEEAAEIADVVGNEGPAMDTADRIRALKRSPAAVQTSGDPNK